MVVPSPWLSIRFKLEPVSLAMTRGAKLVLADDVSGAVPIVTAAPATLHVRAR